MKRYIKASTVATDIVRDLYHRMPNELDFIDERDRPDGRIDLIFEVTPRFKHEAEDICKALIGEGLDARMGRNNRIIIAAPEDVEVDVEACDTVTASVDWSYYNQFDNIMDRYLPSYGEGTSKIEQIVTAITKLVYKWYNDGDVFDNNYVMQGWANDLSSYANWLYNHVPGTRPILNGIKDCYTEGEYEDLLRELADEFLDDEYLDSNYGGAPKEGSIYSETGPFSFNENNEEDEDYE